MWNFIKSLTPGAKKRREEEARAREVAERIKPTYGRYATNRFTEGTRNTPAPMATTTPTPPSPSYAYPAPDPEPMPMSQFGLSSWVHAPSPPPFCDDNRPTYCPAPSPSYDSSSSSSSYDSSSSSSDSSSSSSSWD
jgi:hypothetical protein